MRELTGTCLEGLRQTANTGLEPSGRRANSEPVPCALRASSCTECP